MTQQTSNTNTDIANTTNQTVTTIGNNSWNQSYFPSQGTYLADDAYDYKVPVSKIVELELLDGTLTILKLRSDLIENIREKKITTKKFTWKWPFVKYETKKYVSFDHKTIHYDVNCTLTALAELLELKYISYAELMLKDALKHG